MRNLLKVTEWASGKAMNKTLQIWPQQPDLIMKWRLPSVTSSTLEIEVADAFRKEAKCGKSKR